MQYGGGDRPSGFRDMVSVLRSRDLRQLQSCHGTNQEFGNEQVAFSSEFVVPVRPMSAYIEYAAEDTFHSQTLVSGVAPYPLAFICRGCPNLQLRYEFSEWQSNWYVHHIYLDGMTNYGVVLGQWGAQRLSGRRGRSAKPRSGTHLGLGRRTTTGLQYRTALNGSSTGGNYQRPGAGPERVGTWRTLQVGAH
jgi:hypothetical protein